MRVDITRVSRGGRKKVSSDLSYGDAAQPEPTRGLRTHRERCFSLSVTPLILTKGVGNTGEDSLCDATRVGTLEYLAAGVRLER